MSNPPRILVVEPSHLSIPYVYLSEHYSLRRVSTITAAVHTFTSTPPDLVLISSNFTLHESVRLLETLKDRSTKKLIPIIFVIDFSHRIIMLPGTSWAGQIGVLHGFASEQEIQATVDRLLNPRPTPPIAEESEMMDLLDSVNSFQVSTVLDEDPEDAFVPNQNAAPAQSSKPEDEVESAVPKQPVKSFKPLSHFTAEPTSKKP